MAAGETCYHRIVHRILGSFTGAQVRRVIDPSHALVEEHAHDWPVLSLFVIGAYANRTELGEATVREPSAILYRPGAAHRNEVGEAGFEQIEIEFDPHWIGRRSIAEAPIRRWSGAAAIGTAALARYCLGVPDEPTLRAAVERLLEPSREAALRPRPAWVDRISHALRRDTDLTLRDFGNALGRHPSWLGTAYRQATGEAFANAAARFRIEKAAKLLRETNEPAASIAHDAGFCDQSHMIRTFRRLLGRTPSDVRSDRLFMRRPPRGP